MGLPDATTQVLTKLSLYSAISDFHQNMQTTQPLLLPYLILMLIFHFMPVSHSALTKGDNIKPLFLVHAILIYRLCFHTINLNVLNEALLRLIPITDYAY